MLLALVHRFSPPLLVSLDNNGENTGAIKTTVILKRKNVQSLMKLFIMLEIKLISEI